MKIRYQNGEWWKFIADKGINRVKIIDADNRPLTDETLKELGFEKTTQITFSGDLYEFASWRYDVSPTINKTKYMLEANDYIGRGDYYTVKLCHCFQYNGSSWKTVGSVKMLIEALKGDEE